MWTIIVSLFIGIVIGILGLIPKRFMKFNSRFQQIGVILLLFSMGASIGSNRELIFKLKDLGLKAITFGILTCLFSILFTYLISSRFLKQAMEENRE